MNYIEAIFDDLHTAYETDSNKQYYNTIADQIIKFARDYTKNQRIENIIDICCGTGILTNKLSNAYPDAVITGLDISDKMLSIAREKKIPQGKFFLYDANDLEYIHLKADIIACNYGMQWLKKETVYAIANSLKEGGIFICSLPGYTLGKVDLERKNVEYTGNMLFKAILKVSKRCQGEMNYPKKIINNWGSRMESNDIIECALNVGLKVEKHTFFSFLTEFKSVPDMVFSIIARGTFGNILAEASEEYITELLNAMDRLVSVYDNKIEENISEYIMFSK